MNPARLIGATIPNKLRRRWEYSIETYGNIPEPGRLVLANHPGFIPDASILRAVFPLIRPVATIVSGRSINFWRTLKGELPVYLTNENALNGKAIANNKTFQLAAEYLIAGSNVLLFPEGKRTGLNDGIKKGLIKTTALREITAFYCGMTDKPVPIVSALIEHQPILDKVVVSFGDEWQNDNFTDTTGLIDKMEQNWTLISAIVYP
jgi:1-acyl-sn-glycerol-3-phosphate acyltransferase